MGRTVQHLAVPLFGSTFTTALAFAPIALMPGPAGEFVGSIAINVIVAIFSSLLLAMTVVPALTGFLGATANSATANSAPDRSDGSTSPAWYQTGWNSTLLLSGYRRLLKVITDRPVLGILAGVALPVIGLIQAMPHPPECPALVG